MPAARLAEFEDAAEGILPDGGWEGDDFWRLSALIGADLSADLSRIADFNLKHATLDSKVGVAIIDAVELKATTASEIERAKKLLPEKTEAYFEIPIHEDSKELAELIQAIGAVEAFAKVRTGGVVAEAFPSSKDLARFLAVCAEEDVAFKATAGLHHPLRSVNRLTYKADSASAWMHGFLNVFLAAAFAQNGMGAAQLAELLEETSLDAFRFEEDSVFWREEMLVVAHVRNTRNLFALSFGSCSFTEPVEDLQNLHLL
ncbi:MAG TPA: hypothetical protein PLD20_01190 [Blastocatellia bacterium]|nr:hypothetical protein [Blastocatellia bacterium]HMV86589.1 hypothetical protein [Blastocatellia bacterium]HMY73807.1 hypothetical protein [Blastocatellia bacterium]HMZ16550.1 hypothetical protein [Blastocatellia bacterium]HNG31632.1 hypothetical protein [Blastocatellia bacterium]